MAQRPPRIASVYSASPIHFLGATIDYDWQEFSTRQKQRSTTGCSTARRFAMAKSEWRLEGEWIKNCNCAFGCPCDFNAPPTYGSCKGMVGMRITKGHFDGTELSGLMFGTTVEFPGALHEGNGKMQPIIDERATLEQREALFNILSGKYSAEGTLFHIFSLIVT